MENLTTTGGMKYPSFPGGETRTFKTFVSPYYRGEVLTYYVRIYRDGKTEYLLVKTLPEQKVRVLRNFGICITSYNMTVGAGERIIVGIWASEEAVIPTYDAIAEFLISPHGKMYLQSIGLNLYPNEETRFYVDVPNSTKPGTYKLRFEIHKEYKLSESDPLIDPEVTILPAVATTWKTTTQPKITE